MIGTRACCAPSRLATSKPSMSGSITSSTISCGLNEDTFAIAPAPVPADSTAKPWKRRAMATTSTMLGSSSTTSTRWASGLSLMSTPSSRMLCVPWEPPELPRASVRAMIGHLTRGGLVALLAVLATAAPAAAGSSVRFTRIQGHAAPGTPARYDRVGVLEVGPRRARNVLVLNPGTSASAAYFQPLARSIVARAKGWQVWAVERRENLLEDHSMLDRAKAGEATPQQLFDYYLGYLDDPGVSPHFRLIGDDEVGFAREWGMRTQIQDLRRVVRRATRRGGKVVLGGHSLGGSITTAYATWDFAGRPGARELSGLVFIDGGSRRAPLSADEADARRRELASGSPWLSFGGIAAPFAGLFNSGGSALVRVAPDAPSIAQGFRLLPANLKPPVPATNAGQYGYALDTATSPAPLAAAQAHLGRLAPSGEPRGWSGAGELTPLRRLADMFSGWGLKGLD